MIEKRRDLGLESRGAVVTVRHAGPEVLNCACTTTIAVRTCKHHPADSIGIQRAGFDLPEDLPRDCHALCLAIPGDLHAGPAGAALRPDFCKVATQWKRPFR